MSDSEIAYILCVGVIWLLIWAAGRCWEKIASASKSAKKAQMRRRLMTEAAAKGKVDCERCVVEWESLSGKSFGSVVNPANQADMVPLIRRLLLNEVTFRRTLQIPSEEGYDATLWTALVEQYIAEIPRTVALMLQEYIARAKANGNSMGPMCADWNSKSTTPFWQSVDEVRSLSELPHDREQRVSGSVVTRTIRYKEMCCGSCGDSATVVL